MALTKNQTSKAIYDLVSYLVRGNWIDCLANAKVVEKLYAQFADGIASRSD